MRATRWVLPLVLGVLVPATGARADFGQGFETDVSGWLAPNGYGTIERKASGDGGITAASGGHYALVTQTGSAPYTMFDGYRTVWPGSITTSVDIYLNTAMATGEGFDYSVAANKTDNTHLRDFIFHITQDTTSGAMFVGASNNTNFAPIENLESGHYATIASTGWYTFQHRFYDNAGVLAVDMNVLNSLGATVFTQTISKPTDTIGIVGGNRYGWFTNVDVTGGIAIDNSSLVVPEPAAVQLGAFLAIGGLGLLRLRRRA